MTARRWFYLLLALPLAVPFFLSLLAHLLCFILPDPGFSYIVDKDSTHYEYASGSGEVSIDSGYEYFTTYLTAPVRIYPALIALIIHQSIELAPSYFLFIAVIIAWGWKKPFEESRKLIWKLPLLYYPFFLAWGIFWQSLGWLNLQVIALPILMITSYLYISIAWAFVPSQFKGKSRRA